MNRHPLPVPQRVAWFEGSRLTHRDLADALAHEARMLELHVRGVHDTWGIAIGLSLAATLDRRSAVLERGLAYTCRGESIVITGPVTIAAPPLAIPGAAFDLVLSPARTDDPRLRCEAAITTCDGELARTNGATLHWVAAAGPSLSTDVKLGDELPLGRFLRDGAGALIGPDYRERRVVRGLVRPHVASGVTKVGALSWKIGNGDVYAEVDTSGAGFTTAPVYLASVASGVAPAGGLVGPFLTVGQPTAWHFNVRMIIGAKPPALAIYPGLLAIARDSTISWTGIESTVGCSGGSALSLSSILAALGGTS